MPILDWSQCPAVESVPGKVGGPWVFRNTCMPVQTVFDNLEAGLSPKQITEVFDVTLYEIRSVPHFVSESLAAAPVLVDEDSLRYQHTKADSPHPHRPWDF